MEKATLIKDKDGKFHLLGPGLIKIAVDDSLPTAWNKLQNEVNENKTFFEAAGLLDEAEGFNVKKAFTKAFWLESIVRGVFITIPIFIGFFIFSYAITGQFTKLAGKINDAFGPEAKVGTKQQMGFEQNLERYRPYIHKTLKVWKEESEKVEGELKRK